MPTDRPPGPLARPGLPQTSVLILRAKPEDDGCRAVVSTHGDTPRQPRDLMRTDHPYEDTHLPRNSPPVSLEGLGLKEENQGLRQYARAFGWLAVGARMGLPTQKTCSTAGPLCIIHSLKRFTILFQYTPGSVFVQYRVIHRGRWGSVARRALDAALDAELLLDIFHPVKHILKLTPMHHLITQGMHIRLNSSHSRVKIV